jgi:hypothetical protein
MAEKQDKGNFQLRIPLDASGVHNFKPERAVKVAAYDSKGRAYEVLVKLDAKGNGTAVLSFKENPGSLKVAVGPESATAEQLKVLQTISLDVARRHWAGKNSLTLSPVVISAYYWWWWLHWCRTFRITGVVRCADGQPVPGAKVCASDTDGFWWLWSKQQVGCTTTDEHGAFEIEFTWCCGWWPWWWWQQRNWLLEPSLAERISRLILEDPRLPPIPPPGPRFDPRVFEALLGGGTLPPTQAEAASALTSTSRSAQFDPSRLEGLRQQLVTRLPKDAQLDRLRLWPWWPWQPWWDCTPDIIFTVTQDCGGVDKVIVDETIWDTRWNIPTNLNNVVLVANDQACCVTGSTCLDGGDCAFISNICEDNLDDIGGNPGTSSGASQIGYLNPGLINNDGDRPYSGTIPLRGCVGDTVDYYEFLISTTGYGGPWSDLPADAAGGFLRRYWDNAIHAWVDVPFPFVPISDGAVTHNVIESLPHYENNNGPKLWDAFSVNFLMHLVTNNVLADGTYYLRMRGWHRAGYAGNLAGPVSLPVCGSNDPNGIAITIDNHLVTLGPTDLNGHGCGSGTVHVCTTEPDTEVLSVKIIHSGGGQTDVGACGNVTINDTDMLQIDFVAHDPDPHPHLRNYSLSLHYDVNLLTDLLNSALPGWALTPSPIPPIWAPAAAQVGPDYQQARGQGAISPYWAGGAMRLTVNAKAVFPYTCCYQLALYVFKRTIGGGGASCDHSAWNQWNRTEYSFTITV